MNIVLYGVESNNKGAELMLYAILQEINRVYPDSVVYVERWMIKQGLDYIKTPVHLEYLPTSFIRNIFRKYRITGMLNRIGIYSDYLNGTIKNADYFIDGSGLLFTDKRIKSNSIATVWRKRLLSYKKMGTKVVFLPQGFGPFNKECTRKTIAALDEYADIIFAREKVSYNHLINVVKNKNKVKLSTDFTALVNATPPTRYKHLANMVCLIPNIQMINKGILSKDEYFCVLKTTIEACKKEGHDVYILNHEGIKDELLAQEFIVQYSKPVELVTGLNALEVKGLISTAYLVISSRFHGVASALNGQVPCLATSWHHKYEELFKDYGLDDCVLPLGDEIQTREKIRNYLNKQVNTEIRNIIGGKKSGIIKQNENMWNLIWSIHE